MADGETEKEYDTRKAVEVLRGRFQELTATLKESPRSPSEASLRFCQDFCQVLVEHASRWKTDEDPLPLLEVYTQAILSYAKATPCLSSECENVPLVLEKLALSCVELLLSLPEQVPGALWEDFQSSVKMAHGLLQECGNTQLHMLSVLAQEHGVWSNPTLRCILSNDTPEMERVHEFLDLEGPTLLTMRIKHLMKENHAEKAAVLAKVCAEYPGYEGKGNFKQTHLVYMCMTKTQEQLMEEMAQVDCKDALEMICNLESEGEERAALSLCSVFLKRQFLLGDVYCAWELTLFWSKLVMRVESSTEEFLAQCRKMALLSRSVCHILFLIKVIQSEVEGTGLPACIEMCIQALQMASNDNTDSKTTICKTISCLLPADLEVKRACQLTEFLLQPTVDSYYAVESLYNEPDQKLEEEGSLPVPNSLRCELLLALKTQWPFDPEFWDWRTLKRNCLSLMGDEASIVSSIDTLNDTDDYEVEAAERGPEFTDLEDFLTNATNELNEIADEREKNREAKKLREQGFVSARFRNWRAYMQYCVLCDKEFLGHRIVRHAQKHFKDGVYMCPICADSFESREVLDPHVASHVKQSCKERLAAMKAQSKAPPRKLPQSPGSQSKSLKDSVVKVEAKASNDHTSAVSSVQVSPPKLAQTKCEQEFTDDCSCPVTNCHKVFKFFRHLMCHVRAHKDDEEAAHFLKLQKQKVVCQYCRRHFVNVKHLNDHLQMHCGTRPYFCIQLDCTANFNSNSELLMHKRLHTEFKAQCMFPNCGRVFGEAHLLYDHEAQHYLTYTCRIADCGRNFDSHEQFKSHQESHGPNNAPITSEARLEAKPVQPSSTQYTPRKEERCSAFVRLERINTQDYMRDGALKSASSAPRASQVPKELGPVRVKHSVESMLNSAMSPTEPQKCYTPLTPPPALQVGNSNPDLCVPQLVAANSENPTHLCTDNPVEEPVKEPDNGVPPVSQKALLPIFPTPQIKLENPFSMLGYPTTPAAESGSEENAHSCPFESCPRSYSTNKSLSRHVKKTHPDIFEDWKLAKKYNKVAKITARKVSSSRASDVKSPGQEDGAQHHLSPLCNNTGLQQMEYPMVCSSSPTPCYPVSVEPVPITPMINHSMYPQWGSPQNPTGLIQADMSQAWSSSSINNCYADAYHMSEYPSRSLAQWQSDPYHPPAGHLPERDKEHSMAAIHVGTLPHVTSESSLMNEMSQYVSSSLMLDNGLQMHNGGHQYGMIHSDSVDASLMRKSSVTMAGQLGNVSASTVESMPGGSYNPSYVSNASSSLSPRPPMEIPAKELGCDSRPTPQGVVEIVNTERVTPSYPLSMDSSVDGMVSPTAQTDLPYEEEAESEAVPSDDKTVDAEMHKGKRSRQSKRTKWPAIIKDGKVICRRCFREFTSTKSLGGHLSKRSQCKPLDEVDLTADLPTSFLDFLNDPHVPDTNGALYNMSNGDYPQEGGNITTPKPVEMAQQEGKKSLDSNPSSDGHPNHTTAPSGSQTVNNTSNTASAAARPEANLMDIQNAFQRLDLVEAAREKRLGKSSSEPAVSHSAAVPDINQSGIPKMKVKKEEPFRDKVLKPFKCEEDTCDYRFMTKEALFRHLSRVHDYSFEMIEELKKTPIKLAPYPCQICPKTFTRTTGLRIHYEKVHRLSKTEMAKLRVGCRRKRSSNPDTDTEPDGSSHGNASSVGAAIIKQEPLDVAIGRRMESVDQEGSSKTAPEDIAAAAEQVQTHQVVVEQVHPPENNSSTSSERSSYEFVSPHTGRHALEEQTEPAPQTAHFPKVDQTPSTVTMQEARSDASLGQATEAMPGQSDWKPGPSPEKPSSSKSTPSKDEGQAQRKEKPKKRVGLKMGDGDSLFSPYRPYRCVHEGCSAAFTIQQNLILHYRAMHQSSLPQAEPGAGKVGVASGQDVEVNDSEVRCQVKDCSRIFQGITRLIQHYLLLHKFTRDKATAMVSSMKVGTFQCDMSQCTLSFDSVDKYIEHIKNFHKEINISESGSVDQTFKCEHEGCDRVYTTRSNLLRHLMKKHDFVCETKTQQSKPAAVNPNNGKENIENKFKLKKKNIKKKEGRTLEHWTSFGKPSLKSHEEASAMCTKKSSLQYPCMIKGCDAVERAERNIFRHYTTHGLTERYIEDQRSLFIFCKKLSRSRFRDSNKSEGMSTSSSSVGSDPDDSDAESSKVSSQAQEPSEDTGKEEAKLSNDESSESTTSTGEERKKRGRPRKSGQKPACPERRSTLRTRSAVLTENSDPGTATSPGDQSEGGESFTPLGFESSFLQFLETADSPDTPKRKMTESPTTELPPKRQRTLQQKTANIMSKIPDEFKGCQNLVDFRNPLNLKSVKNVKIVMDKTFSDGAELLLKQLQDMRPMVIIKKWLYS